MKKKLKFSKKVKYSMVTKGCSCSYTYSEYCETSGGSIMYECN